MRNELTVEGVDISHEIQVVHNIDRDEWDLYAGNGCEDGWVSLNRQLVTGLRDGLTLLLEAE